MNDLQIALEQIASTGGDVQLNIKMITQSIERAKKEGAELIVFPELCVSGYGGDDFFLKDQFLESCYQALLEIAEKCDETMLVLVGYPEKTEFGTYSSIAVISDGRIIGNHRKTIIPNLKVYSENRYFTAGTQKTVIEFKGIKIGIIISEELFEDNAIPDSDLLCCCSAFPWSYELSCEREAYLQNLSQRKKIPIVYVNNIGITNSLLLEGHSAIYNDDGQAICILKLFAEDFHRSSMNDLMHRDHYPLQVVRGAYIAEVYSAIKYIIREFILKVPQRKVLVLMDGTLNTELIAFIAMKALGPQKVAGLYIQSRWDSSHLKTRVQQFIKKFEIKLYSWDLGDELVHGFISQAEHLMDEQWKVDTYDRFKASIFVSVSELLDAWPINSVDKTQIALGLKDNISSFASREFMPLNDIYHSNLIELAEYINSMADEPVFSDSTLENARNTVVKRTFIHEFKSTSLQDIDEILVLYIEKNQSVKQILQAGYDKELVTSIVRRIHKEEWNRVQAGFSPKLSNRSFKNDWIFPSIVDWDSIDVMGF